MFPIVYKQLPRATQPTLKCESLPKEGNDTSLETEPVTMRTSHSNLKTWWSNFCHTSLQVLHTQYMLSVILVESQEVQESIFANLFARSHFFAFLFSDECLTKIQSNFRIVSKSQWNYKVLCYFKIGNMCREHLRSVKQNLIKIKQNSS